MGMSAEKLVDDEEVLPEEVPEWARTSYKGDKRDAKARKTVLGVDVDEEPNPKAVEGEEFPEETYVPKWAQEAYEGDVEDAKRRADYEKLNEPVDPELEPLAP